ncbi:ferritin-like domain-containing protein [Sphingomonas sp. MMS24-J13]|uniref:ferritin-like domain-containing protein n=1 Tax=Sphingomonas sp. MMS24-J13 TaxID=3238686 RepID=UPI00384B5367
MQATAGTACLTVLSTADPAAKIRAARQAARDWRLGRLGWAFDATMPDRPARPDRPELLAPRYMPKRRKGGGPAGRIALLHALAHIEFVAIDLAFDLIGRFGARFPRAFVDDWMRVGADEAMHFAILDRRLRQLGSFYGALPAHDGLWEAAELTAHDALARIAIVPMILEARALDITPQTIARLEAAGDPASAQPLRRIMRDEIVHVAAGVRWFRYGCVVRNDSPPETWRKLVSKYFRGSLKPPFNDSARAAAGLTTDFYSAVADPYAHAAEKFLSSREGLFRRRPA